MGMAATLLNDTQSFEQIVNILWPEGPMLKLVKIIQDILNKKKIS